MALGRNGHSGVVDDTGPRAGAEGRRREYRVTPEGNRIVEEYVDNNSLGGDTSGRFVQGPAADGDAVLGNPVRIAGKDGAGLTQDLLMTTEGRPDLGAQVIPSDGSSFAVFRFIANNNSSRALDALNLLYNGGSIDVQRNNVDVTILASAARTTTTNSPDQTNHNAKGVWLMLDITVVSGTSPTLDVKVQRKDAVSSSFRDLPGGAFPQHTAAVPDDLVIYPSVAEVANEAVSDIISRVYRVVATIGGTSPSFTFSLGNTLVN